MIPRNTEPISLPSNKRCLSFLSRTKKRDLKEREK